MKPAMKPSGFAGCGSAVAAERGAAGTAGRFGGRPRGSRAVDQWTVDPRPLLVGALDVIGEGRGLGAGRDREGDPAAEGIAGREFAVGDGRGGCIGSGTVGVPLAIGELEVVMAIGQRCIAAVL